ncbi:hypothetical protein BDW74DRAFT_142524 [Aspergillus multicolor]|uniref:uncharacterized protein n=1 Tax=Aspergillus multicolor TaxID=41759 RepID=UPI003CCD5719
MEPSLILIYYLLLILFFLYLVIFHFDTVSSPSSSTPSPQTPAQINALVTELDDFDFYHHPSWPQHWTHPEFTGYYDNTWREAPWYQQTKNCRTARFLMHSAESHFPWGLIIYRTVYTPESDRLWPIVLAKIDAYLDGSIAADLNSEREKLDLRESDLTPERLLKESRKHVIFSDKRFWDGVSTEAIRAHFSEYLRASKGREYRFRGCLVIDERSLDSIARSSDQTRLGEAWVNMVDGRYPHESGAAEGYRGFMRVDMNCLWVLYCALGFNSMREVCPKNVPEGLIGVYDEGTGMAHNKDGNIVEVYLTKGRNRGRRLF